MENLKNVLITGTPGTGKTTLSEYLSDHTAYKHLNISELVKTQRLHEGRDEAFDTFVLDEDKLLDYLDPYLQEGGYIIDFHSSDFFPRHWFHYIVVLRSDTNVLYDRLNERGYSEKKLTENMECEIMQVVLDEVRESYDHPLIHCFVNNTMDDFQSIVTQVTQHLSTL